MIVSNRIGDSTTQHQVIMHLHVPRETLSSHGSELNTVANNHYDRVAIRSAVPLDVHGSHTAKAAIKANGEAAAVLIESCR